MKISSHQVHKRSSDDKPGWGEFCRRAVGGIWWMTLIGQLLAAVVYTWFSFALTDPNLTYTSWGPFFRFQWEMWATFAQHREVLVVWLQWILGSWVGLYVIHVLCGLCKEKWTKSDSVGLQRKATLVTTGLMVAILVFSNPALSHDMFNYLMNARMVIEFGIDPHIHSALESVPTHEWLRFMHNVHTPAPYGYGWTALSLIPSFLGGGKFLLSFLLMKVWSVVGWALMAMGVKRLADEMGRPLSVSIWGALLLSPLLLIELVGNGHNDAWMLAPAVWGFVYLLRALRHARHRLWVMGWSLALLGISVSVKLATLALLPVWLGLVLLHICSKSAYLGRVFSSLQKRISHWHKWLQLPNLVTRWQSRWPLLASLGLFVPLFTERSQQFHPWYLSWSLIWVPLVWATWWGRALFVLSLTVFLRYFPFLSLGDFNASILLEQRWVTWLPLVVWVVGEAVVGMARWLWQQWKNSSHDTTWLRSWKTWGVIGVLGAAFLISRLWQLGLFPVFADEAIYIRWAQLIIDDPWRYLFFALNDGKTPLFVWLMVPFQFLVADQLIAGRVVAVLGGVVQALTLGAAAWIMTLERRAVWLVVGLMIMVPFLAFLQRLALMDGWLAAWVSLVLAGVWGLQSVLGNLTTEKKKDAISTFSQALPWTVMTGLGFGLALWTKLPGLFLLPVIGAAPLLLNWHNLWKQGSTRRQLLFYSWLPIVIGLGMFALLRLHPAFSQLFRRSGDFSLSMSEIVEGVWLTRFPETFWSHLQVFLYYLTPPVFLLAIWGVFFPAIRKKTLWLLFVWACLLFPFTLFGKTVHARYLLPAAVPLVIAAALSLNYLVSRFLSYQRMTPKRLLIGISLMILVANSVTQSLSFQYQLVTNPESTPLLRADRGQYLEDWSSGQGLRETASLIRSLADQGKTITVATEGSYGTLPDGLLLFFHRTNVTNIWIEGMGLPVDHLPQAFIDRARKADYAFLVVNSHRRGIIFEQEQLVLRACRPNNTPCLEVWDVLPLVQDVAVPTDSGDGGE